MNHATAQRVRVLDFDAFLKSVIGRFADTGARCSLEGQLERYNVLGGGDSEGAPTKPTRWEMQLPRRRRFRSSEETAALRRTGGGGSDFFVTTLDGRAATLLLDELLADQVWTQSVEHLQIETRGRLAVGTYDLPRPDSTWIGKDYGDGLLGTLATAKIVELVD